MPKWNSFTIFIVHEEHKNFAFKLLALNPTLISVSNKARRTIAYYNDKFAYLTSVFLTYRTICFFPTHTESAISFSEKNIIYELDKGGGNIKPGVKICTCTAETYP